MITTTDPVTAYLETVRKRHTQHVSVNFPAPGICVSRCAEKWPCSSARLAEAMEAALKQAADWEASADRLDERATELGAPGAISLSAQAAKARECAEALRAAISAALTGNA